MNLRRIRDEVCTYIAEMSVRVAFKLKGPFWTYRDSDGIGVRRLSYSIRTDKCLVRFSRYGVVTHMSVMKRKKFLKLVETVCDVR